MFETVLKSQRDCEVRCPHLFPLFGVNHDLMLN